MTDWRIQVDDAQFRRSLRRLERDIIQEAEKEGVKVAARFENHLTRNTPVLTGDLAKTTKTTNKSSADKVSVEVSVGDGQSFHARWLEFGHANKGGGYTQGARFFYPLAQRYNRLFKLAGKRAMKRIYSRFNR